MEAVGAGRKVRKWRVEGCDGGGGHPHRSLDGDDDSPGPKMTASMTMMLSGHGLPEMPSGASAVKRLKSRIRRRLERVDWCQRDRRRRGQRGRACSRHVTEGAGEGIGSELVAMGALPSHHGQRFCPRSPPCVTAV